MVFTFQKRSFIVGLFISFIPQINAHNIDRTSCQSINNVTFCASVLNNKDAKKDFLIDLAGSVFLSNIYPLAFSIENKSNKILKFSTERVAILNAKVLTQKELSSQISSESLSSVLFFTILFPLFPIGIASILKKEKLESLKPILTHFSPADTEIRINPGEIFKSTSFVQVGHRKNNEDKLESYVPSHFEITLQLKEDKTWNLLKNNAWVFNLIVGNAINL